MLKIWNVEDQINLNIPRKLKKNCKWINKNLKGYSLKGKFFGVGGVYYLIKTQSLLIYTFISKWNGAKHKIKEKLQPMHQAKILEQGRACLPHVSLM